jgi:hypothetical protein
MIDKIELIDEKVLFKLSDDMKIDVRELGSHGHRVVVIDNFYENPEMIRELAFKSSYTSSTKVRYGAPIFRNEQNFDTTHLVEFFQGIIKDQFDDWHEIDSMSVMFNATKTGVTPTTSHNIHIDGSLYGNIVYLNDDVDCVGGTSWWKHISSGLESCPTIANQKLAIEDEKILLDIMPDGIVNHDNITDFRTKILFPVEKEQDPFNEESNGIWKQLLAVNAKYNRMVIYPGSYFHSADLSADDYVDSWRLCQVGMLD